MHRIVLLFVTISLYYVMGTYSLYFFDAGLLVSSFVLFGLPAFILAYFTVAPPAVLVSVTLLGGGIAILLEGIAHIYGLWYSIGMDGTRLFQLIPVEVLLATTMEVVFLSLLYEVLFDDGVYTLRSAWERMTFFGIFGVAVTILIGLHQYVFPDMFYLYSYLWIIGIILASSFATLILHKNVSVTFFDRIIDFSLIAAIPIGLSLWISVANVHKVFAYTDGYIGTLTFYGQTVPLEEIILLFALPFFVGTMYEMYLDDQA